MLAVADRAMFSDGNLDYMDKAGIRYIVAARLRRLPKEMRRRILTDDDFRAAPVGEELAWLVDRSTGRRCLVPSHVTVAVKEIYHAFGKALGSPAPSGLRAQPRRRGGVM